MGRTRRRSAALVLSLLQHVRHSYRPHAAVETRAPEGHWLMNPLSPEHMAAPGLIVYGLGRIYSTQTSIVLPARRIDW
jgi:hypothetical protein